MLADVLEALERGEWIAPAQLFDGWALRTGMVLRAASGGHLDVARATALPARVVPHDFAGLIAPGFFDIQVNGGGGALFNAEPTRAGLRTILKAHRRGGTGLLLPTVITDTPEVLEQAVDTIITCWGEPGIAGIHIEGPHISPLRRGTHRAAYIRPYDERTDRQIARLRAAQVPVLLTVAPEMMRPGQIADLVARGVVVSLGHSAATYDQAQAALAEGAQTFTHLMNAMPPLENRNPGIVGAALNADRYCSIIFDGLHVAPEVLRIVLNARHRTGKIIAVTDAMPTLFGPDRFQLYDMEVQLADGRLINPEGSLAGAHLSMLQSLAFMVHDLDVSLEDALRAHITNPCELMGLDPTLEAGATGLVLVAPELDCCILRV